VYGNGGAISDWQGLLNIDNSTFDSNSATNNGRSGYGRGGAIEVNRVNNGVNIKDSTFTKNIGNIGAAIHTYIDTHLEIIRDTFINNKAVSYWGDGWYGGAINTDSVDVDNSTFQNNTAAGGGAIFAVNRINVKGASIFTDNTATIAGGGAFKSFNRKVYCTKDTILRNNQPNDSDSAIIWVD
jgi:predicted outer membrane repeat protein